MFALLGLTSTDRRDRRAARKMRRVLDVDFGHRQSRRNWQCIDSSGCPIPWYTYPAIEYLQQLDFTQRDVFEFGSGNSTLFWAKRARSVTCVEHDPAWHERVRMSLQNEPQVSALLHTDRDAYIDAINKQQQEFDVIIVDGEHRPDCAREAVSHLSIGGMIILDNSDWHPKIASELRAADFIEVDMFGFGPINPYTWTTSLFLHRECRFTPRDEKQPIPGIGSID